MQVRASLKHLRVSPRKVRLVIDTIRGLPVEQAMVNLTFMPKRVAIVVKKLLAGAVANAEHNHSLQKANLYVKEIVANEGVTLKRWLPRAHGRATPLRLRSSHIEVVLGELVASAVKGKKKNETLVAPTVVTTKPTHDEHHAGNKDDGEASGTGTKTAKGKGIKRFFQRKSGGS